MAEWEKQHHHHVRIALTTSMQTTNAILADPVRSKQIAVVDMRYWVYQPDGTLFAPKAGENHAFRELISTQFKGYSDTPPPTTPEQVYRQVREYRDRYPDIALVPMESGAGPLPILMGGGLRNLRCWTVSRFAKVAHPLTPSSTNLSTATWRKT